MDVPNIVPQEPIEYVFLSILYSCHSNWCSTWWDVTTPREARKEGKEKKKAVLLLCKKWVEIRPTLCKICVCFQRKLPFSIQPCFGVITF